MIDNELSENLEPENKISKEDYLRAYDDAVYNISLYHQQLIDQTTKTGYSKKILEGEKPTYAAIYDDAVNNPERFPVVLSGYKFVRSLGDGYRDLFLKGGNLNTNVDKFTSSSGSFGGTIETTAAINGVAFTFHANDIPNPLPGKSNDECLKSLGNMDLALAKTYAEVWETYYGTKSNPHRSALFMFRQVFDHFFSIISPDDKVLSSQYWRKKTGPKPYQIFRSERFNYAAYTHIGDTSVARIFAELTGQINDLYELANDAHNRGDLDEGKAEDTLREMDNMLKKWLDVLAK